MLRITPRATMELRDMLARFAPEVPGRSRKAFRLIPESPEPGAAPGVGLALDEPREDDEVVWHQECVLLIVDEIVSQKLDGLTLDLVEAPDGERFSLRC